MGEWFEGKFERGNVHSSYDFRRRNYLRKIILWLILIVLGIFIYLRFLK